MVLFFGFLASQGSSKEMQESNWMMVTGAVN